MQLVEPAPLHPGVRPVPERASFAAIRDEAAAPAATKSAATDVAIVETSPTMTPSDAGVPATGSSEVETQTGEATATATEGDTSAEEQPRKRHDKRRRRPRRSGKRRRKGGNTGGGDASSGSGDSAQSNS
ncbi:MAG: hypothetical protein ACYTGL_24905 [Planctomycetota bacterium]